MTGGGDPTRAVCLFKEKKLYNTQQVSEIAVDMKCKTYLRSAARTIGMDAGNLSRLARNYGVQIDDEAALIRLGRSHQREPSPVGECVVPVDIAIEQLDRMYEDHNRQFQERNLKFKKFQEDGAKIVKDFIRESNGLRQFVLQTGVALEPVLKASWHGKDGLNLTAEQVAAIQDCFGDGWAEGLEALRQRQNEMESPIAEATERPAAN
jgi:hypothetical protein